MRREVCALDRSTDGRQSRLKRNRRGANPPARKERNDHRCNSTPLRRTQLRLNRSPFLTSCGQARLRKVPVFALRSLQGQASGEAIAPCGVDQTHNHHAPARPRLAEETEPRLSGGTYSKPADDVAPSVRPLPICLGPRSGPKENVGAG